jgi:hypothetical protein
MKIFYYGLYRYVEMKRPKKYITSVRDNIPCTALHPINIIMAENKKEAIKLIKDKK